MKKFVVPLIAGALLISAALPFAVEARRGGGGPMGGTFQQTGPQDRDRLRLRDGSCLNSNTTQAGTRFKRGNAYGPGDGRGNAGNGPKDGSGYGARSRM